MGAKEAGAATADSTAGVTKKAKSGAAPAKPVYQRSEFWLTLVANGIAAWQTVKPENPYAQIAGALLSGAATATYNISRGKVKVARATNPEGE